MRRVSEDPIPEDILKQMVDAGIRAPSGSNRQGWKFIVVTDQEIKNQLGDSLSLIHISEPTRPY